MAKIVIKKKTQIEEERLLDSLLPSEEEVFDAELEIKILNLLLEVGR